MKRIVLLVLVFIAFYGNAFCDDIIYMVTKETILRNQRNQVSSVMTLQKGETVSFQGEILPRKVVPFPQHSLDILVKTKQGNIGWIENENVLLKDYLPLPQSVAKRYWIYSFYQQFVSGAEKEMLFNYEPFWRDEFRKFASTEMIWLCQFLNGLSGFCRLVFYL